jgi:hypothetical protein
MRLYEMSENLTVLLSDSAAVNVEKEKIEKYIRYYDAKGELGNNPKEKESYQELSKFFQMKLNNLSSSAKQEEYDESLLNISNKVKNGCSHFYQIFKQTNKVLYRGISKGTDKYPPAFESISLSNRRPKDSDFGQTLLFDNFLDELGIKARRMNSIFTTSFLDQAITYGHIYIIYPTNSVDYSWSEKYNDLTLFPSALDYIQNLDEFQKKFLMTDTKLSSALMKGHELLISGKYIAIKQIVYDDMAVRKLL